MTTVYVDMDGVLADFEGTAPLIIGEEYNWKEEVDKPNWGVLSEYPRLYRDLQVMNGAYVLMEFLQSNFRKVEILTAIPKRAKFIHAVNDKRDWIHAHFGKNIRVNFGPYAYDKQFHIRNPTDILIDDMEINITQWKDRGAIGILHTDARSTIEQIKSL